MTGGRTRFPPLGAFIAIGVAFIAIGIGGNVALVAIGCAFLAIGVVAVARRRRRERAAGKTAGDNVD